MNDFEKAQIEAMNNVNTIYDFVVLMERRLSKEEREPRESSKQETLLVQTAVYDAYGNLCEKVFDTIKDCTTIEEIDEGMSILFNVFADGVSFE